MHMNITNHTIPMTWTSIESLPQSISLRTHKDTYTFVCLQKSIFLWPYRVFKIEIKVNKISNMQNDEVYKKCMECALRNVQEVSKTKK